MKPLKEHNKFYTMYPKYGTLYYCLLVNTVSRSLELKLMGIANPFILRKMGYGFWTGHWS